MILSATRLPIAVLALLLAAPPLALASPEMTATEILTLRPFAPFDRGLFVPEIYPDTPPLVPASGPPTEAQVQRLLVEYLKAQFPTDPDARAEGLALFKSAAVKAKIPNPSLRAAFVGLKGTIGEPAIDFTLNALTPEGLPFVKSVRFALDVEVPDFQDGIAVSVMNKETGQFTFFFNRRYEAENPFLFTHTMAHEPLHSDPMVASFEEAINLALHTVLNLQQLARHPELALFRTELARRSNSNAMLLLNSGTGSDLGLYASNGNAPIFPGSPLEYTSWWQRLEEITNYVNTPGNDLLAAYLANLQEPGNPPCSAAEFSQLVLDCIDQNHGALTDEEVLAAAEALRLDTVTPVIGLRDHFMCYTGKPAKGFAPPSGLSLVDRFGSLTADVKKAEHLCAPADKNDEGVVDPATHLTAYALRLAKASPPQIKPASRRLKVVNQLGTVVVDTGTLDGLLVPTAASTSGVPTLGAHDVDYYTCYAARIASGSDKFVATQISAADGFADRLYNVLNPWRLCTPVAKNGEAIKHARAHLMCYQAAASRGAPKHVGLSVNLDNQFGVQQMATVKEAELCVPSRTAAQ